MTMTTIQTKNYDMNIWDEVSYNTSGKHTGGWKINFYQYPQVGVAYGSGKMLEEYDFYLTPEEAKQLTLGWDEDLGGYGPGDDDFFIDIESFLEEYKDIPQRLLDHIETLPYYEQSIEPYEPSVKWAG